MKTLDQLATTAAAAHDITEDAALDILETYTAQIEALESREIDRDEISDDDAAFLLESVAQSLPVMEVLPLQRVEEAASALESMTTAYTDELHVAIRAAIKAGAPIAQVAKSADMSRTTIYKIIGK